VQGRRKITHKFYCSQENGEGEGEYDAPKLPILRHALIVKIREQAWPRRVGGRGQGRRARRDHHWAGYANLSMTAVIPQREEDRWRSQV